MLKSPPPDPNPKKPRIELPPNACDAVCHVIGPRPTYPFSPDRKYDVPDAPAEALFSLHKILGFERAALVQATVHGSDNRAMVNTLERSGGRYRGVAIIDGNTTDVELESMDGAGVCGVRYNFVRFLGGPPSPTEFERDLERIAEFGWHVALHVGGEEILEHEALLRNLPVPAVIEHLGRVDPRGGLGQRSFQCMLDLMRDGMWVKIDMADRLSAAGAPYTDMIPFVRAIVETASERVLWGTDWPHPMYEAARPMPNDGDLVNFLADCVLSPDLREQILVRNAAQFYRYHD
jgi:predicted TIM-barrel fold metal-dependent hydrolase